MTQMDQAKEPVERELYQLPGRINIQARTLPEHYIVTYQGVRVPQFATITQIPVSVDYEFFHPNFGPFYLPNDYPAVPYPANVGMQWIGYLAPNPQLPVPQDCLAFYINPYDINGPRSTPPHLPPQAKVDVFPPAIHHVQVINRKISGSVAPPPRPKCPAPLFQAICPPPRRNGPAGIIGTFSGGVYGLQDSLLNCGRGPSRSKG
ncbi:hypothetical protein MFRU_026g00430 [Monilinia fructicola]|uniref:Uncharacterized protein n=1 Tax=Monilinia fructicola TaxID=38448 RepID=A0A5M9JUI8_MONFR|nr:hypothetical protein EYC84_001433 [Monilinia fructicola]KAG4027861.1 hypothetical protein MFRU_026g00430 [Monilinia fructicola]